MIVECRDCSARGTGCRDCVVCLVLGHPDETQSTLTADEQRAVAVLAEAGMVAHWGLTPPVEVTIMRTPHRWQPPAQQAT